MKRITVWIDSEDDSVEQVRERLEEFLAQIGLRYRIVETCELIAPGESR